MRYEVQQGGETFHVEVREAGAQTYDVTVDDGETVRVDAFKNPRTVYSILIGARQYEGSVDELEDGTLDVHVGTSAFAITAVDERRKLLVGAAGMAASGRQEIKAQMPGKIVKVLVSAGETVEVDQGLLIIEAMKMENEIKSPIDGTVTEVEVREGDAVETDALLVVVEPPESEA
jgi:biotin carboxyl carrier protein